MPTTKKLKYFKVIKIISLVLYIPLLLYYLIAVVPEYLVCLNYDIEGALAIDNWGYENPCFGENKDILESLFQLFSIIIAVFSLVILILFYVIYRLKKQLYKIS